MDKPMRILKEHYEKQIERGRHDFDISLNQIEEDYSRFLERERYKRESDLRRFHNIIKFVIWFSIVMLAITHVCLRIL